jgi:surfeit locus 1 family protein
MTFRPLKGATLSFLPAFALLVALGVWQLERREWKLALIAEMTAQLTKPAVSLESLERAQAAGEPVNYRPVVTRGRFDHTHELYLFRASRAGEGGYHIVTPFLRDDGLPVLVDRGFVPPERLDPTTRAEGNVEGEVTLRGIARASEKAGPFTPANEPENNLWYLRDAAAMGAAAGLAQLEPFFIEADATENPGGLPVGGQTELALKNPHLGYALTWFGLAGVLTIVYLAYHRAQGRLG